jgi:hypothetical protein
MFDDILFESEEAILQRFYRFRAEGARPQIPLEEIATGFKLRKEQLICAYGFNPVSRYLIEILPALGYATWNELVQERNNIFTSDIYKRLSIENVLKIYERIKSDPASLDVMQYLLHQRLEKIEGEIESTVNSMIIERYKSEMRAIYSNGIANIDFTEERLDRQDSGFRALLNEVSMIVESKIIPVGEIFFRNTILPQEKQRLLNKGLIPKELVQSRVNDPGISADERKILNNYLRMNRTQA